MLTLLLSTELKKSMSEIGSERYDLITLNLKPFGGSLVILTPFCRIETGKVLDG